MSWALERVRCHIGRIFERQPLLSQLLGALQCLIDCSVAWHLPHHSPRVSSVLRSQTLLLSRGNHRWLVAFQGQIGTGFPQMEKHSLLDVNGRIR
jgi:hypothetical protein